MLEKCYDFYSSNRVCLPLEGGIAFVNMDLLPLNSIFNVKIAEGGLRNGLGWELQAEEGYPILHGETSLF